MDQAIAFVEECMDKMVHISQRQKARQDLIQFVQHLVAENEKLLAENGVFKFDFIQMCANNKIIQ